MKILIALLVGYTALAEPGRPLYENNCAVCHGDAGLGNGPASAGLNPKPRNLVQDDFKAGDSKEQVLYTVSHGLKGTAMPPFESLTDAEKKAIVDYVLSLRGKK